MRHRHTHRWKLSCLPAKNSSGSGRQQFLYGQAVFAPRRRPPSPRPVLTGRDDIHPRCDSDPKHARKLCGPSNVIERECISRLLSDSGQRAHRHEHSVVSIRQRDFRLRQPLRSAVSKRDLIGMHEILTSVLESRIRARAQRLQAHGGRSDFTVCSPLGRDILR
jgi:hypothetical protein